MLNTETPVSNERVIEDLINEDLNSEEKLAMLEGVRYYRSKNTKIMSRKFNLYTKTNDNQNFDILGNSEDIYRANNKLANGFLKTLIDQKINYSLSKPFIVQNADNINNLIDFSSLLKKMCKESSKKSVEWAHPYINSNGEFKVINVSAQEIIPVYDNSFEAELKQIIRYYSTTVIEGTEKKQRFKVELWDKEKVTYYMQDRNDKYHIDVTIDPNPRYHWNEVHIQMGKPVRIEGHGWGKVPFVPLWNNDEHTTDLEPVKAHIDVYDIIESDFANNIEDLQDAVIKLVNYGGITENLNEFIMYLKKYKVLPLDAEGNAEYMTTEIPVIARETMLQTLRNNIFDFGQGVDVTQTGDGNITNVVIKNRYAGLDLKANDTEARIIDFVKELAWFCNEYLRMTGQKQDVIKDINMIFNRSIIINTKEIIDGVVASKGIISDRTAISNHPWVTDVDEEIKQMKKEREEMAAQINLDGGMEDEDEQQEANGEDKQNQT
jgi:SPP1 family phage portal protein